jgi:phosphoenolpyruvate phosphomutase
MILISAGDSVTAKLVQEAGFDGIWVSGFEASARLGLKDDGSITMTEMLNVTKPIVDAVKIPVYVDVDTGYGNFARTVKEFQNIGAKGLCVEDNITQKTNSLWGGKAPLMPITGFCLKLGYGRQVKSKGFHIIARTEALIRGYGMKEALKRGLKYAEYADFILIHSRDKTGKEAIQIGEKWHSKRPLAIVPTKFPDFTNSELKKAGFKIIVWANQTERVKIKSIRDALKIMKKDDCAKHVEDNLSATLDDMKGLT